MSETAKKVGLIVLIVLAVGGLAYSIFKYSTSEKMIVDKVVDMPPGHKSEKQQALDAQKGGAPAPGKGEETDLGGDLGGK